MKIFLSCAFQAICVLRPFLNNLGNKAGVLLDWDRDGEVLISDFSLHMSMVITIISLYIYFSCVEWD